MLTMLLRERVKGASPTCEELSELGQLQHGQASKAMGPRRMLPLTRASSRMNGLGQNSKRVQSIAVAEYHRDGSKVEEVGAAYRRSGRWPCPDTA